MKQLICIALMGLVLTAVTLYAADYRYLSPIQFKEWLDSGQKAHIVDIQVPAEYAKHHLPGALETNAYPVKSDEEKQRLDPVVKKLNESAAPVVIVCPRGGGGARNTYDYLLEKGVDRQRLYILEKGMEGWPYPDSCLSGR